MELRTSLFVSFLIHSIFCFLLIFVPLHKEEVSEQIRLQLSKGQIPSLFFHLPQNEGQGQEASKLGGLAGTPEAEIERFKNEIHYPPAALEQRLESDCSWELEIGPEGIAKKIRTVKGCKYPIFESHFRRAVSSWKFQLPEGKVILIPVSFRIESDE
ncbi:TonB-dependent receptor [Leptospira langatensis]|uniref:TonB-dependent receptor n=1 Tax=Leptospira langatensis TaxID=2484983 RepID=A0A5F1ZTT2_9LEPT|nr:energy transducer TonB [Leptospira langatensis]TGK03116.1 TonB-dependent receptor [Leptospira langatensis]TGL41873.1 TonB-dependent receptor [Leptospira langatensis]